MYIDSFLSATWYEFDQPIISVWENEVDTALSIVVKRKGDLSANGFVCKTLSLCYNVTIYNILIYIIKIIIIISVIYVQTMIFSFELVLRVRTVSKNVM